MTIQGSCIGRHPLPAGRDEGYTSPARRAYSDAAKRNHTHGFRVIYDPCGAFQGCWFTTAEITDCLRYPPRDARAYPSTLAWLQGLRVAWYGQLQEHFTQPRYGLIYGRCIYETDAAGDLLMADGAPVMLWEVHDVQRRTR